MDNFAQLAETVGAAGIVLTFLLLHLLVGFFLSPGRPFLWGLFYHAGAEIERRLNRPGKTPAELYARGAIVLLVMALFGFLIGRAFEKIAFYDYGWLGLILLLLISVSALGPLQVLRRLDHDLTKNKTESAADLIRAVTSTDTKKQDGHSLIRSGVSFSALSLNSHFIAPIFWYVLGGPVFMMIYIVLSGLRAATETPESSSAGFFSAPIKLLHKVMDFIPLRLTFLLMVLASFFVSGANPWRSFKTACAQAKNYRPADEGLLVAAMAGGLGVTLGGPVRRKGLTIEHGWVGPKESTAKLSAADLKRAAVLHFVVFLCGMILTAAVLLATYKFS